MADRGKRHPRSRSLGTAARGSSSAVSGLRAVSAEREQVGPTDGHVRDNGRACRDSRPELRWPGRIAVGALTLLGIGAIGGGMTLVASPDGSVAGLETSLLAGSPFPDYLVPGVVLGGLFGIGSLVVAGMGVRRSWLAPFLAFAIGCAQMIWIGVELAVIRDFSFLQPTCFAIGLVIAAAFGPLGVADLPGLEGRSLRPTPVGPLSDESLNRHDRGRRTGWSDLPWPAKASGWPTRHGRGKPGQPRRHLAVRRHGASRSSRRGQRRVACPGRDRAPAGPRGTARSDPSSPGWAIRYRCSSSSSRHAPPKWLSRYSVPSRSPASGWWACRGGVIAAQTHDPPELVGLRSAAAANVGCAGR